MHVLLFLFFPSAFEDELIFAVWPFQTHLSFGRIPNRPIGHQPLFSKRRPTTSSNMFMFEPLLSKHPPVRFFL